MIYDKDIKLDGGMFYVSERRDQSVVVHGPYTMFSTARRKYDSLPELPEENHFTVGESTQTRSVECASARPIPQDKRPQTARLQAKLAMEDMFEEFIDASCR